MHLTRLEYVIWGLWFGTLFVSAAFMLHRKSYRQWPFLFALTCTQTLIQIALYSLSGRKHYPAYFYTYWTGIALCALLQLGVVVDIVRAIPRIRCAPWRLMILFVSIAATISIGSAWMASDAHPQVPHATAIALTIARSSSVLAVSFGLSMFLSLGSLSIGWSTPALRVASGFLVANLMAMAAAYVMTWRVQWFRQTDQIQTCLDMGVWVFWTFTACRTFSTPTISIEASNAVIKKGIKFAASPF